MLIGDKGFGSLASRVAVTKIYVTTHVLETSSNSRWVYKRIRTKGRCGVGWFVKAGRAWVMVGCECGQDIGYVDVC